MSGAKAPPQPPPQSPPQKPITLSVKQNGELYWDDEPINEAGMQALYTATREVLTEWTERLRSAAQIACAAMNPVT